MVKLKIMRLVNCQSWSNSVIGLSEGLNVIKAPNNTGKSVIFKILKAVCSPKYYNNEERAGLIRDNAEYAEATYLFTDNSMAIVRIFKNKTIYYFTNDKDKSQFTATQDTPPPKLIENLNMLVEPESGFIVNLLDLDQDLFLVKSDSKSNHNIIKVLAEHDGLRRLCTLFRDKIPRVKEELLRLRSTEERLAYQISQMQYINIDELESEVNEKEFLVEQLKLMRDLYINTDSLLPLMSDAKPYDDLILLSSLGQELERLDLNIDYSILGLNINQDNINLCDIGVQLESIYNTLNNIINSSYDDTLCELALDLIDIVNTYDSIDNSVSLDKLDNIEFLLNLLDTFILLHSKFLQARQMILKLETDKLTLDSLKESMNVEGRELKCPLYGTIKVIDGKCIPVE